MNVFSPHEQYKLTAIGSDTYKEIMVLDVLLVKFDYSHGKKTSPLSLLEFFSSIYLYTTSKSFNCILIM
jgi:hypothetical protein